MQQVPPPVATALLVSLRLATGPRRRRATGVAGWLGYPGVMVWVFGYGSLVWRPAFPHLGRLPAYVEGFKRRFWQGSSDHRGVPGAPGRVVTLLPKAGATTWGMAYEVAPDEQAAVLAQLDHREKGGYARHCATLHLRDRAPVEGLVYVATEQNAEYLGPAPLEDIADQVRRSAGPSGSNVEYVLQLARALEDMGAVDPHVVELARLLESPGSGGSSRRDGP